jgi:hypothetical protein
MDTYEKKYMKAAIREAKKALAIDEVPIGCIIVKNDKIIARAYNKRVKDKSSLSHAEILTIKKACKKIGDWRLEDCTMYITLEPCPMCAGAIVQARIPKVVIATMNPKAGCAGSVINLLNMPNLNHQVEISMADEEEKNEAAKLLQDFFKNLRTNKMKAKSKI